MAWMNISWILWSMCERNEVKQGMRNNSEQNEREYNSNKNNKRHYECVL